MSSICVIPARGGSRRVPGKNIRLFHGKPIIAYSIDCALESGLFDEVLVSTDDIDIARIAQDRGVNVSWRPDSLAEDNIGTQEVMRWTLEPNPGYAYACCLYATAPMATPEDLRVGYRVLIAEADYGLAYAVGPDLSDAGQWYWGTVDAFLRCDDPHDCGAVVVIPPERVCDINTEDDWKRAERMYAKWKGLG